MAKPTLSTTFTAEEVTALIWTAQKLQQGGDPRAVVGSPAWQFLVAKFHRLAEKAKAVTP